MNTLRFCFGLFCALFFSIQLAAQCGDLPCQAVDLGVLPSGGRVGDGTLSSFNNNCGTKNPEEPDPIDEFAGWGNNVAVWLSFTTSDNPGNRILIRAFSDPENIGDPVNLQLALYESDNNACDGNLSYVNGNYENGNFDEELAIDCEQLSPNTTYFIMVDGVVDSPEELTGVFGLEVWDIDAEEGGDLRCDAFDLGTIPENGQVVPTTTYSNYCAGNSGDPFPTAFGSQVSVWFRFTMPSSGNVRIDATTDENSIDPIAIQLALYQSLNDLCTGSFGEIESVDTRATYNESITTTCLEPGRPYWILVDGEGRDIRGLFNISVIDLGTPEPTRLEETLCFGESLQVLSNTYTESGSYADTLTLPNGCDTIVRTELTVLEELITTAETTLEASDEGATDAQATVTAIGGTGDYTYLWPDGQTTATATGLVGGQEYCVIITDSKGCTAKTCLTVEFNNRILPIVQDGQLDCNGDTDGELAISATRGTPPYTFTWEGVNNDLTGNGTIPAENEVALIENLPAGDYRITFADVEQDTTVVGTVTEPEAITIQPIEIQAASCFGECNGSISVTAEGGTLPYEYNWSNGASGSVADGFCAGTAELALEDANGCVEIFTTTIQEPEEFVATVETVQNVSCFGDMDGQLTVSTNGNPLTFNWDNGAATATLENLAAGNYAVTVTNEDDCTATASGTIEEPSEPVSVALAVEETISCFGDMDGALRATPQGPGEQFTFTWSAGTMTAVQSNLAAGSYSVTIANENGCTAMDSILLEQPESLAATFSTQNVRCNEANNSGSITIESVRGGVPPYEYSLDGIIFIQQPRLSRLAPGSYSFVVRDANACEFSDNAGILPPPDITVDLGEDILLPLGRSVSLQALTNSTDPQFSWKAMDSLACANCSQIEVMPTQSTTYNVQVVDLTTKCTASDAITVNIDKSRRVFIPNAFSPNEDGDNDVFTIYGDTDVVQITNFQIFDRTGTLVYEANNFRPNDPQMGWDGRVKGELAFNGLYVYYAQIEFIDGLTQVFEGEVAVVR